MRVVQLDFLQTARRASSRGVVLFATGVAATFVVLSYQAEIRGEAQLLEAQVAKLERRAHGVAPVGMQVDDSLRQEVHQANEVVDQLALPWGRLFRAVEAAATNQVALLGIAPDGKAGTVQITAETADPEAMFDYISRLGQQSELSDIYLLQHQLERGAARRPLRFTVVASWIQRRD